MFSIGSLPINDGLMMAPMCGITHRAFRSLCKDYGAALTFTQMVAAKAIIMKDKKSLQYLSYTESERPIVFQLFGNNAEDLAAAAKIAEDLGPDGIDLNMGCPARKVVHHGGGSALLKDSVLAKAIFKKMRAALKIPFTVKMRSGWENGHRTSLEIAKIAEDCGVDAITLHARTRAQGYSGKSDWSLIKHFKEQLKIPVIGNGDVSSVEDANQMIKQTGCDAVMVGRAGFSTPWIFKSFKDQKNHQPSTEEMKRLILEQYDLFFEYFGMPKGIKEMRKHLCAYSRGIRNGAEFRNKVVRMEAWEELKDTIESFFVLTF